MSRWLRSYRVMGSTAGLVVLVALVVAANYLSTTLYERYDLTGGGARSLSDGTERILQHLERDAVLHFFPLPDHVRQGPHTRQNRRAITNLLREYTARTDHLTLRLLPPAQFPDRVRALASEHGVNEQTLMQREPVLITVPGTDRHRVIPFDSLHVIRSGSGDSKPSRSGTSVSYAPAERAITSALLSLTRSRRVSIGYSLPSLDDQSAPTGNGSESSSALISVLAKRDGFDVRPHARPLTSLPSDLDVFILHPGSDPLSQEEEEVLRDYLAGNGSVIALTDPEDPETGTTVFEEYGVRITDHRLSAPTSANRRMPPGVEGVDGYRSHAITDPLIQEDVPVYMRDMRVVTKTRESVTDRDTTVLIGSTRVSAEPASDHYRYTDDQGSILPVAVASEPTGGDTGTNDVTGRLVVFGDADWTREDLVTQLDRAGPAANLPLFRNAVRWCAGLNGEIRYIPHRGDRFLFVVTEQEAAAVFTLVVLLMPGCALLLGILLWWFRRMRV